MGYFEFKSDTYLARVGTALATRIAEQAIILVGNDRRMNVRYHGSFEIKYYIFESKQCYSAPDLGILVQKFFEDGTHRIRQIF